MWFGCKNVFHENEKASNYVLKLTALAAHSN